MLKVGLHFRYEISPSERSTTKRLVNYTFDHHSEVKAHDREAPEGRIFLLKCLCGSNNWTENGRFMNEYECASCGQFVQALFTNHGRTGEGD